LRSELHVRDALIILFRRALSSSIFSVAAGLDLGMLGAVPWYWKVLGIILA